MWVGFLTWHMIRSKEQHAMAHLREHCQRPQVITREAWPDLRGSLR